MDDRAVPPCGHLETAALENIQHADIFREDLGDKLTKPSFTAEGCEMALGIGSALMLVVVAQDAGESTIVGGGRYAVVQPGRAEVAFAVVDAYQAKATWLTKSTSRK